MDAFVVIALVAVALLVAELLLPTGGLLAVVGALALIGAGVLALNESGSGDWIGPALITAGILSAATAIFVGRKVLRAQTENPVETGRESLIGAEVEVRTTLDPEGQVWSDGALWRARLTGEDPDRARPGDRVVIEAVDGLTLVVRPVATPADPPIRQGAN